MKHLIIAALNAVARSVGSTSRLSSGSNDKAEFDRAVRGPAFRARTLRDGGLVLGAGLSGGTGIAPGVLHAQSSTPYFEVAEINVKDQAGYEASGVAKVRETMAAYGGKIIAGGYNKATSRIAAPPANRYLIVMYSSKEASDKHWGDGISKWWESEGHKYADFRAIGVEGIEQK